MKSIRIIIIPGQGSPENVFRILDNSAIGFFNGVLGLNFYFQKEFGIFRRSQCTPYI